MQILYRSITTIGHLPDGRKITTFYSFPRGATLQTRVEIAKKHLIAYPYGGSIQGEYLCPPSIAS